jgi:hypothetical protein
MNGNGAKVNASFGAALRAVSPRESNGFSALADLPVPRLVARDSRDILQWVTFKREQAAATLPKLSLHDLTFQTAQQLRQYQAATDVQVAEQGRLTARDLPVPRRLAEVGLLINAPHGPDATGVPVAA